MPLELSLPLSQRVLPKPEVLKRNIVEKLDKMEGLTAEQLARVYDFLLQMEMERLLQEIQNDAEDVDLSPEAIDAAKLEHRRNHPYGR